ncbi:hypothetical protein [Solibacillus isronensis]|uniref:hypothetical protein n=1 Tax=Solibacillus isronensis TaxID=412383 RepID=UPI0039A27BF6
MTVNMLLVKSYASNVYMTGRNSLANIGATRPEYVEPVKQQAADTYYIDYIDNALTKGWITAEEHAETLALKDAEDPQYMPPITLNAVEPAVE